MDEVIYKEIVSCTRGIEVNLRSRKHFTPGNRTHAADPKKQ